MWMRQLFKQTELHYYVMAKDLYEYFASISAEDIKHENSHVMGNGVDTSDFVSVDISVSSTRYLFVVTIKYTYIVLTLCVIQRFFEISISINKH